MADINKIAEELGQLTVLEAAELVKKLEEDWGVSAAAPVAAVAAAPGAGDGGGAAAEEKTEFDVLISGVTGNKIAVIKEVRATVAGLGLADAKKMVDECDSKPVAIKEGASKEEADELKKKLEEAGAKVEVK